MAEYQLPATFANYKKSAALAAVEMESAGDGVEPSFGVLKFPAKNQWALRIGGRDYAIVRPDDGTPQSYIDVCFVRAGTTKAKTFYEGGYKQGSKDRPTCWSNDAVKPDTSVPRKVSDSCLLCPKNKVGSAVTDTGKSAKACPDHKRTAVFVDPPTALRAGAGVLDAPVMLRIPGASLTSFGLYGDNLKARGLNLIDVVTRVSFDTESKFQKLVFTPVRPLTDNEGLVAIELRESVTANQVIGAGENQLSEIEAGENEHPAATVYQIRGEGEPMTVTHAPRDVIDLKPEPAPSPVEVKPPVEAKPPPIDPEEEEMAKLEAEMAARKAAIAAKKAAAETVVAKAAEIGDGIPETLRRTRTTKPKETKPPQQVALADGDDGAGGVDIPDDLKGEIAALLGAA